MSTKTIRDIVKENSDLHFIKINKPCKNDKSTWTFDVIDKTSQLSGLSDYLHNYYYQIVQLRRDEHYFIAYKIYYGNVYEYFVDCRKSNHRNSTKKYIQSLIDYSVYSNDISETKNTPSFKITEKEMKQKNLDNYLDLCHYFGKYSAIGTGYTRNVRNIVVMDIDVDCTREDNQNELNNLLLKFARCNSLPDFYILNHNTNHVQLQWLVKSFEYKNINNEIIKNIHNDLKSDINKNKEIKLFGTDFTTLSDFGLNYRQYTLALTNIVKKHKFGDKHYTFWKAKNFYSALLGEYNLELKMPQYRNGQLTYLSNTEMLYLFSTKELRQQYYNEAPTIVELYQKTKSLLCGIIEKVNVKKVKTIQDDSNKVKTQVIPNNKSYGKSRNTFVLTCTRETTWEIARMMNFKSSIDLTSLDEISISKFKAKVHSLVKRRFNKENKKYHGVWPDTSNYTDYSNDEFESTFNNSFLFAINNYINLGYSEEQRKLSIESKHLKRNMNLVIVDYVITDNNNLKTKDILTKVNNILDKSNQNKITIRSLHRYINYLSKLDENQKHTLYTDVITQYNERKRQLIDAKNKSTNTKLINTCKKRFQYVSCNVIDDIKAKLT